MLHDMLVVGAGPAGILVWERLTAAGLDAVLLEAGAKPAGKVPLQGWANRSL
jgi:cation diffusion facilitator CzcD-associated flavoprotein CzcO